MTDIPMTLEPQIAMIWAQSLNQIIGEDGDMPWFVPEDFAHFKSQTFGSPVIMGRATWESLPEKNRPLPGRKNIVLSRNVKYEAPGADVVQTVQDALLEAKKAAHLSESSKIWVIGGGTIYKQFMEHANVLEVTNINLTIDGDTLAPVIPQNFSEVNRNPQEGWHTSRTNIEYAFSTYMREGDAAQAI